MNICTNRQSPRVYMAIYALHRARQVPEGGHEEGPPTSSLQGSRRAETISNNANSAYQKMSYATYFTVISLSIPRFTCGSPG